jgi:hypothetical protein
VSVKVEISVEEMVAAVAQLHARMAEMRPAAEHVGRVLSDFATALSEAAAAAAPWAGMLEPSPIEPEDAYWSDAAHMRGHREYFLDVLQRIDQVTSEPTLSSERC